MYVELVAYFASCVTVGCCWWMEACKLPPYAMPMPEQEHHFNNNFYSKKKL